MADDGEGQPCQGEFDTQDARQTDGQFRLTDIRQLYARQIDMAGPIGRHGTQYGSASEDTQADEIVANQRTGEDADNPRCDEQGEDDGLEDGSFQGAMHLYFFYIELIVHEITLVGVYELLKLLRH